MLRSIRSAGISLCVLIASITGCQRLNEKAHNTGNFISGSTQEFIPRSVAEVTNACRQTVDEANLTFISSETQPIEDDKAGRMLAVVTARTHSDDKITFTIVPNDQGVVLTVNSGILDDTDMRHRLLDTVNRHLGYNPQQPSTQPATLPG